MIVTSNKFQGTSYKFQDLSTLDLQLIFLACQNPIFIFWQYTFEFFDGGFQAIMRVRT
jgi:hypothetical protein